MTILQFISAAIIGFSIAGMLFSLLNSLARRRADYMLLFAALSLFTALYTSVSLARRGCADVDTAILLTRFMDTVSFAIFLTLPFLYLNLSNQKPGKTELIFSLIYLATATLAMMLPYGFSWTRLTAMVPIDLGRLGTVYRPEGIVSPLTMAIHAVDITVMGYCSNIAWRRLRPMHGSFIFIAVMPFVMVGAVVYIMGNQQGWWHLPAMNEVVCAALYLAIGYMIYNKEKSDFEERRNMVTSLNTQAAERHAMNVQLQATNQQLYAANMQLTAEIDTRIKTESALRLAENRYRVLFNNSFELVGLLDPAGILIEVNQTALSLIGATEDAVKGKHFWECPWWSFDPKEQKNCKASVYRAAEGNFVKSEAIHVTPAGEKRFIDFTITPVFDENKKVIFLIPEGRDITQRRQSEQQQRETNIRLRDREQQLSAANQQLKASQQQLEAANQQLTASVEELIVSEEKYRSFIEHSTDGLLLVDEKGTIYEWNKALETITGYTRNDVAGKPWLDIREMLTAPLQQSTDLRNWLNLSIEMILSNGTLPMSSQTLETRLLRKDGVEAIVQQTIFAIPSGGGFRVGSINRDITEIKKAQTELLKRQQQIIQADKMASLGLMVSGIGHEINNPNNLIMLNSDVVRKIWNDMRPIIEQSVLDNNKKALGGIPASRAIGNVTTMLSGISEGSRRIATLVASLKDFARLDEIGALRQVDIGTTIEAARLILHHHVRKATNQFSIAIEPDLPAVFGNSQKIEQILINLIVNACQALPSPDRKVEVRGHYDKESREVVIDVEDEGCGIPEEIRDKIMDPFFTTKADAGGTGLGLSVTYGLVKDMNAAISFTSFVGKGTCFSVRFKAHSGTSAPVNDGAKT